MTRVLFLVLLAVSLVTSVAPASAQSPWPRTPPEPPFGSAPRPRRPARPPLPPPSIDDLPRQVISTGPLALMLTLPNAEYEVRAGRYLTVGASAARTLWPVPHRATSGELFVRVFPGGLAFHGASVGFRTGYTRIPRHGTFRNLGMEGAVTLAHKHFYMSTGIGAKLVVDAPPGLFGEVQPIVRMNVGIGF